MFQEGGRLLNPKSLLIKSRNDMDILSGVVEGDICSIRDELLYSAFMHERISCTHARTNQVIHLLSTSLRKYCTTDDWDFTDPR